MTRSGRINSVIIFPRLSRGTRQGLEGVLLVLRMLGSQQAAI